MKNVFAVTLASVALSAVAQTLPPPPVVAAPKSAAPVVAAPKSAAPVVAKAAVKAPPVDDKLVKRVVEQPLPGLGVMPGEKQLSRANVIRVQSDRNEIAYVSSSMANRISTPFDAPRVIDTQDVEYQTVGQSIYLLPKDPEKPVALYITGSNANDPVVSLTLVPKPIPQQTIVLQIDAPLAKGGVTGVDSEPAPVTDVYSERLRYLLRQVALNKVPEGFAEGTLPNAAAVLPGVSIHPMTRYSGPAYDIYRYRIRGTGDQVELAEDAFYTEGVRAVAFFPTAVIRKGEETTIFVVADKRATEN
nr:type-F conjugative transfer system secretin TraK [Methylibium petroleiphilum]